MKNAYQRATPRLTPLRAVALTLLCGLPLLTAFESSGQSCNRIQNGDFESSNGLASNPDEDNILGWDPVARTGDPTSTDGLPNWHSIYQKCADYYNTNFTNPRIRPQTGVPASYGPFPPHSGDGVISIFSSEERPEYDNQIQSEYVHQPIGILQNGKYYAEFWIMNSHFPSKGAFMPIRMEVRAVTLGQNIERWGDTGGFTQPIPPANTNISSTAANASSMTNWGRVSGILDLEQAGGYKEIILGCYDFGNNQRTTVYAIDDVALYKIPTAGANQTAQCNAATVVGEGCAIPGATYAWTAAGSSYVFATTVQASVQPNSTTTYTLKVTLPDGSTSASSATVTAQPAEPKGYFYVSATTPWNDELRTYQYVAVGPGGSDIGMFLGYAQPYTFDFKSDLPGLYLTNTRGTNTHFILKPGQGTTITATAINSPCPMVGRFAFIASTGGYSYRLAPNPASADLTVTATDPNAAPGAPADPAAPPFDADLYDSHGKKVKSQHSDHGKATFDVRDLPEGLYNLRSGKGKEAISERIQVTH